MRKIKEKQNTVWRRMLKRIKAWHVVIFFVVALAYLVVGINWLSYDIPMSSNSIEESKSRGVFLKEVQLSKDSIRVWDSVYIYIRNGWIEYPWYHGRINIPPMIDVRDNNYEHTLCLSLQFRNEQDKRFVDDMIGYLLISTDSSLVLNDYNSKSIEAISQRLPKHKGTFIVNSFKFGDGEHGKESRDGIDTIDVVWGEIPKKRKWYDLFGE